MKFLKYSRIFRTFLLLLVVFGAANVVTGQESRSSNLYKTLKNRDSLVFEVGFNQCNLAPYDTLISEDLEFYHDRGGITNGKVAFIKTVQNNICNGKEKPRRELVDSTLKVFPLYNNGVLYGAIQEGVHLFYIKEINGWRHTATAAFTHLWILNDEHWQLKRVLSYDHH